MSIHDHELASESFDEEDFTEVDSEGSWAVSYGDMVTLLLSFFILFFNLDASTQAAKAKEKEKNNLQFAIVDAFGGPKVGVGAVHRVKPSASEGERTGVFNTIPDDPVAGVSGKEKALKPDAYADRGNDVQKAAMPVVADDGSSHLEVDGQKIVVDFGDISFFQSGGLEITPEGEKALDTFSKKFVSYAGRNIISIRAFTDGRPVRQIPGRRFKDNIELSALRAISAMRHLQHQGIPLSQMRIGGYGELKSFYDKKFKSAAEAKKWQGAQRKIVLVIESNGEESFARDFGKRDVDTYVADHSGNDLEINTSVQFDFHQVVSIKKTSHDQDGSTAPIGLKTFVPKSLEVASSARMDGELCTS